MYELSRNPMLAPEYALHRVVEDAIEVAPFTNPKEHGINMASHSHAHIQVLPSALADPDVRVLWWSEKAGSFIDEHSVITRVSVSAGTAYEFTVEARGRIMLVVVDGGTMIAADVVEIWVSGYNVERV